MSSLSEVPREKSLVGAGTAVARWSALFYILFWSRIYFVVRFYTGYGMPVPKARAGQGEAVRSRAGPGLWSIYGVAGSERFGVVAEMVRSLERPCAVARFFLPVFVV